MILAASELQRLTGYTRASAQVRWLRARRMRYTVNSRGRVVVARLEVNRMLGAKSPLVEQTPALLTIDALRALPRVVPAIACGVYFLWSVDELLYIGRSGNVLRRLSQHLQAKLIPFDSASCVIASAILLEEVETAYIRAYRPPFNRT